MLIAETSTCLFWFAGFIATSNLIRKLAVCRGLVCSTAIAGTIFGAFQFALFAATSYFAIQHVVAPSEYGDGGESLKMSSGKWWRREKDVERI